LNIEIYKGGLIDRESDILRRIEELENEIIMYMHGPCGEAKNNEKIMKIYFDEVSKNGIPSLSDILDIAYTHNEIIYSKIAELTIISSPGTDFETARESIVDYYFYYSSYYDLGAYIEEILLTNNLCFIYGEDSDIYYHIDNDDGISVVANDCQNTLLGKMAEEDEFLWGGDLYGENIERFRVIYT